MADNAIDKLIEETRAAYTALEAVEKELVDADRAKIAVSMRHRDAKKRCDMLDLTMKKHIHENMPVVQAKMIAHEEIEQIKAADRSFANVASRAATLSSSQLASASAAINGQLASMGAAILSNAKSNGSLNLSI